MNSEGQSISKFLGRSIGIRRAAAKRTEGFVSKVEQSANGAEYVSQGQARSEAERVAPGCNERDEMRPERPKYRRYFALSGLQRAF
jgi:hypothetical protein